MESKKIFHRLSYLKFPFYVSSLYYLYSFFRGINQLEKSWENLNVFLILCGIGLAFSSLKDSSRKSSFLTEKIYGNPFTATIFISMASLSVGSLIILGLSTLFFSETSRSETIGVGLIVLGIGAIGYLKYAVERIEKMK